MHVLRAEARQHWGEADFHAERIRPGAPGGPDGDLAFGPLSVIDHAGLAQGKTVAMHEHRDDEILSYLWRGGMTHEDEGGHRVAISATRPMMMNAGAGFRHEESAPDGPVEMLQIFVRPRAANLPGTVAFAERPNGIPEGTWGLIAGPEGSGAPLTIRNAVHVFDVHLRAGEEVSAPAAEGLSPWLYVLDGGIELGGERLAKGDAARDEGRDLPLVRAARDTTLVLFLVDRTATGARTGTISGR